MALITLSHGVAFEAGPGETLLDAAMRAGVVLDYSCRSGRCSACKCKVLDGASAAVRPETGLSDTEKAAGWILSCVRVPASDMTLEADALSGIALPAVKTLPCRIDSLRRLAPDVLEVALRLPPASGFAFLPGQYIEVIGPNGVRRSYSLAAADASRLVLHVRAVGNGVLSAWWFGQARPGDLLRLRGPYGTSFLRDAGGLDLVFLATGTGIAPVKAMLEGLGASMPAPRSVAVYWGGRTPDDLYCDPVPAAAAARMVPVLSRADAGWSGARGHVQDVFLAAAPDLASALVYACGSDTMIVAARSALQQAGLPARRFLSDAFVCSATT